MTQILTLKSAGYVSCVEADKGRIVSDDAVNIGILMEFDNAYRIWVINTPNTILVNSVMAIVSGTGAGTAYADSILLTGYCSKDAVKERMLINTADNTYDGPLDIAIAEGSRLVDIFLKPYTIVPLTNADSQIAAITADFASSVFKRRMLPDEVKVRGPLEITQMNEIDATSWFAMGVRKIEQYIRAYYILNETISNSVHNPDLYIQLLQRGVITGKEARKYINDAAAAIVKKIDETHTKYITSRQKSFAFIQGKEGDEGYEQQPEA